MTVTKWNKGFKGRCQWKFDQQHYRMMRMRTNTLLLLSLIQQRRLHTDVAINILNTSLHDTHIILSRKHFSSTLYHLTFSCWSAFQSCIIIILIREISNCDANKNLDTKQTNGAEKYGSGNRTLTSYNSIPYHFLSFLLFGISHKLLFTCCKLY